MPFSSLPATIGEALVERGYTAPTDVQSAAITPETQGRDLLVSAQTGSGKTVAFGLAMAKDLLGDQEKLPYAVEPLALIVAPTRELAMQVQRELTWLYAKTGARVASCVGGMNIRQEQRALQSGAHIVVGTPGRLRDHLERGSLATSSIKVVVLDEADEMLDMGFREEIEEILDVTPAERRTLLFSATMPRPIAQLAKTYQRDALRIQTNSAGQSHADIDYRAIAVSPADIENAVVNVLRFYEANGAMVFCATRENVRRLQARLVERGFSAVALSGELSQNERNHALQALRDRRARVCVATDVASRGIDLPNLGLVVHAELPIDAETLQHRSGRTGRAGRKGTCVMIVPYQRRRRAEGMMRAAAVKVDWVDAPSADDIRARDQERLLETIVPGEQSEDDLVVARKLLERHGAEEIAAALVRAHRRDLPEPEELHGSGPAERRDDGKREGFDDTVWFRMSVGRNDRADPRWILPLLCRRGHITKNEVGAIRIGDRETMFQIPRAMADRFAQSVQKTATEDDDVVIEMSNEGPPPSRGGARRSNNGPAPDRKYSPKPYNKGGKRPGRR